MLLSKTVVHRETGNSCGGGAECAHCKSANCRRDVANLLYTAKPTARQGQGHCTLLWISRNTQKFFTKTNFNRRSHITWALISLKFASFAKFMALFFAFFGLFARAMHSLQTFALVYQTATARCAGVDGGCGKIFAHFGTKVKLSSQLRKHAQNLGHRSFKGQNFSMKDSCIQSCQNALEGRAGRRRLKYILLVFTKALTKYYH